VGFGRNALKRGESFQAALASALQGFEVDPDSSGGRSAGTPLILDTFPKR